VLIYPLFWYVFNKKIMNTSKTAIASVFYRYLYYLFALAIVGFTIVMLSKILPYMTFERAKNFLGTKSDEVLDKQYFIIAFYVHISTSVFALGGGVFQFSTTLTRNYARLHQWIGKIYIATILLLAAPSGLIIAAYANGGLGCKVGFVLQSFVWWILTYWAYQAILERQYLLHTNMMLRSFALTLAAMSLRTESYIMYYFFQTKPIETYQTVTWLSWVGNLLFIEVLIYYGLSKRLINSILQK
jgi:hypothetical protein